jgi:phosphoribosylaminoimidazolecarboxamide formyltransferase/IMP cyclohydrolase
MPTALISVSDKTGLTDFASRLAAVSWNFLASGGTARHLAASGLPVREVADYTGSPEILGGRVKTLHPALHGGILARATESDGAELSGQGWIYIDMVVVNLYPFEATVARAGVTEAEGIEDIDIGGVALIRAAAKNFSRVALVCEPGDYDRVAAAIEASGALPEAMRKSLAVKGFALCARYDAAIASWLDPDSGFLLYGYAGQKLRYGENPHQAARFYTSEAGAGPLGGRVLQGKELSYNNILDLDAAWRAVGVFDAPAAVVVKHLSPCGVATASKIVDALAAAVACDPVSAFGGVIAMNRAVDAAAVRALGELFVECIIAPGFDAEARALLATRKNARLVEMGAGSRAKAAGKEFEIRGIAGGFLKQDLDSGDPVGTEWKIVSARVPTLGEMAALRFAWKACLSVKSNAILLAAADPEAGEGAFATLGIGSGQPNRVDSVRIAVGRAGVRAKGSVLASDAFFPFSDSVEEAAKAGVTAIVHPGGSMRDALSLAAADSAGMAMILTGVRHFRH